MRPLRTEPFVNQPSAKSKAYQKRELHVASIDTRIDLSYFPSPFKRRARMTQTTHITPFDHDIDARSSCRVLQ